jgi:hypothetical protein
MPMKARIPSDPLIRLIFDLNRTERPEWEERIKREVFRLKKYSKP